MNKRMIFLISLVVLYIFTTTLSFASDQESEFLIEKNEMTPLPFTPLSDIEIQLAIDAITKDFNENILPTLDREQALLNARQILSLNASSHESQIGPLSDYDDYLNQLRQGNFIEGILDLDEGLSDSEIFAVGFTYANEARSAALDAYPDDDMLADAYRHFAWNYISTLHIGQYKTRTATINHEWGILMIDPITDYFTDQYNDYVDDNDPDAAAKAFSDAILYITNFKYQAVTLCQSSFSFFSGFFEEANIMDLHNNCYGRAYAVNNPDDGYDDSFELAKSRDELILDEDDVGSSQYQYVWQNNWYTYRFFSIKNILMFCC